MLENQNKRNKCVLSDKYNILSYCNLCDFYRTTYMNFIYYVTYEKTYVP